MIQVFKIIHNIYYPDFSFQLTVYHSGSITRGNKYELTNARFESSADIWLNCGVNS